MRVFICSSSNNYSFPTVIVNVHYGQVMVIILGAKVIILEKWFPLQGERAHTLHFLDVVR